MMPARAIAQPGARTLEMIAGPRGLFDQDNEPFALWRAPFRITAATLEEPGVDDALAVLATLAPAGTNWLASAVLQLGEGRGVWRVGGHYIAVAPSLRVGADPVFMRATDTWYATFGLPRMPDGLHRIEAGGGRLLHR